MPCNYYEYPSNWNIIRERILMRANNKCEFCNLPNGAEVHSILIFDRRHWIIDIHEVHNLLNTTTDLKTTYKSKLIIVSLAIAHLDHDHNNHLVTDDRLRALCQKCHLSYDKNPLNRRKF